MIDLSITPLHFCNLNCEFCYLGRLRYAKDILDLQHIEKILNEYDVRILDIYGGEITLLDDQYVIQLVEMLKKYFNNEKVFITSNAIEMLNSVWLDFIKDGFIYPSFSYDTCRPKLETIRKSIQQFDSLGYEYSIICLDIADLDYEFLVNLKNMKSFSIKPFSRSKYMDDYKCSQHMVQIYENLAKMPQLFNKLEKITEYRDRIPHYFLLPDGKLYDIQYDDGKEYFCNLEKCSAKINANCLCCKYYKCCFNEHYAGYVIPKDADCLGRKHVMELLNES